MKFEIYRYLVVFSLLSTWSEARSETPQDFLDRYNGEVHQLTSAYGKVHIVAQLSETVLEKKVAYESELYQDGKRMKVVRQYVSGDRLYFKNDKKSIEVANPDRSFDIRGHWSDEELTLAFFGQSDSDYNTMQHKTELASMLLRSAYMCAGTSLPELLNRKETTITAVKEQDIAGERLIRVETYILPYNDGFREMGDHAEGWFLLDPARAMAMREFNLTYQKRGSKQLWYQEKGSVDYNKSIGSAPAIERAKLDLVDENGETVRTYRMEVKSITFGPIAPAEFTLPGCGLPDIGDAHSRWRVIFYWSLGITVFALALIFVIRRRVVKAS